ncbi:MAG: hypothetical protein GXO07_00165 [Crenarchaeota archaeon]|nr:hypothetical protein [Thermoproteota archaeon]
MRNKCYMLSKDASEDVVALSGTMDDIVIKVERARYMRALDKGPTYVRTYDLQPDDLIVAHYHCGIPPEPSSIDVDTMKIALRAQLYATIPGKPRVFGIISPVVVGRSFCLDIGIYEPVPDISIMYNAKKLKIKDIDNIAKKKGFAKTEYDRDADEYSLTGFCSEPDKTCVPYRYGNVADIVLEDLIFIASYRINFDITEFPYLKITPSKAVAYEVKVSKLSKDRVVVRGVTWSPLKGSPRGRQTT